MKIGVLIDRLNVGGVEKGALQEVLYMRKLGVDATLLVLSKKSVVEGAHSDLVSQVPVIFLDERLPKFLRFTFKFPVFAFFSLFHITYPFLIPWVLREKEFDYIISHNTYTSFSAIAIRKLKKIPYSVFLWDPIGYILPRVYSLKFPSFILSPLLNLAKLLDSIIINNSDIIFVASPTHNAYVQEIAPDKKIIIVNPATPLGTPTSQKEDHVLLVTTWKAGKNPEYILEIARMLPNVTFKMVGGWIDPAMKTAFINLLHENNMESQIELLGEANEEALLSYYPKALVQLTTNLEKGFGMPVIEAAGCGTVSIIPVGSGVCSVLEDNVDAFFTEEKDTGAIVACIKKLLSDKQKAIDMGLNAYNKVKKSHTWEAHAQTILESIKTYA